MKDGDHKHDINNPLGIHEHKIMLILAILALVLALIAYNESINPNIAFEVVVNNTNLAPTIHPSIPGTGERVNATTYYANTSAIDLHVFAHANNVSGVAGTFVYINGTLVCARSGRPLGAAEAAYRGCDLTIPKHSYYRVEFYDYHHYEWREYPILSGRNGSISINQTSVGNINTFDEIFVNTIGKNSTNSINFSTNYIILNNETGAGTVFRTKSGHVTLSFIDDVGDSTFSYEGTSDISNLHSSWRVDSAGITFVRDDEVNFTSFTITTLGVQITCPAGTGLTCIS